MNRLRGEAPLADTGKVLVFDANAFCDIEEAAGLKIGDLSATLQAGVGMSLLRTMLWAGLQHKQPGTTVLEAGELISDVGIEAATLALTGALTAAFGSAEGNGATPAKKPGRGGTGSAS